LLLGIARRSEQICSHGVVSGQRVLRKVTLGANGRIFRRVIKSVRVAKRVVMRRLERDALLKDGDCYQGQWIKLGQCMQLDPGSECQLF
jgi:hypothetical protein